jgi:hypothetical protein
VSSAPKLVFVVRLASSPLARFIASGFDSLVQATLSIARQLEQQGYITNTEKGLLKQILATASQHTLSILLGSLILFQESTEVPDLTETLKVLISSKNLI